VSSIDEKRVHGPDSDPRTAYIASETGVATVALVGERVGGVSLVYREPARDVAACGDRVLVATAEDVVKVVGEEAEALGFGPARAVGVDAYRTTLAGGEEGLARYDAEEGGTETWRSLGSVGEVRAIDGDLVASSEGVYRVAGEGAQYSGLDDASDVTSAGMPHAATSSGLYALGNGWLEALTGAFTVVTSDPRTASPGVLGRAHAVSTNEFYEHTAEGWRVRALPGEGTVVDVAYGDGTYAVTDEGTLLTNVDENWREHPIGVRDVRAIDVVNGADR
jgi:hypothetical protein